MLLLGWNVVPIHLRTDGDTCHAVLFLNFFGRVPFGQVGIHFVFGKGGIDMFLAVIVELANSYLRNFVLPCISPHPFGVDLIFLCNFFSGIILGDVEIFFGHYTFIRFGFHHQFDVRTADERLLAADA